MAFDGTLKFDTKLDSTGLNSGMSKLGSMASKGFSAVGKLVGVTTAAVTAFGASALKAGGDFSSGMSKVEAIAGDALTRDMDGLRDAADRLGVAFNSNCSDAENAMKVLESQALKTASTSSFTAGEAAEALTYMGMAGWGATQMIGGLPGIMNLAEASGQDLASTSDIVTDAMTAFGMVAGQTGEVLRLNAETGEYYSASIENTTRFVDVLAAAATSSNTNVELMGETFKYVAPVAGSMGYTIEDTAQAIGLMANQGIKGSQAGTALRNILTNMTRPTDSMKEAMDRLGISLDDGEGHMYSLMEVMKKLRDGFSGLKLDNNELIEKLSELDGQLQAGTISKKNYGKEVKKLMELTYGAKGALDAEYASMLAGKYGMSGLLAIVNASDDDFEALARSIASSEGRAAEMALTMKDNLPGAIEMANSALDILKVKLEKNIELPAKDAVKAVTQMVNDMTDALDSGGMDALAGAAGDSLSKIATMAMEKIPTIIDAGVMIINAFLDSISSNDSKFTTAAASIIVKLVEAIISVSGKLWSVGLTLLRKLLEGLSEHASEIGQAAGTAVGNLADSIRENTPLMIQAAKDLVAGFCEGLSEEFPGVSALLEGFFAGFTESIIGTIENVAGVLSEIFEAFNGADPTAMRVIGEALGHIAAGLIAISAVKSVTSSLSGVVGTIAKLVTKSKSFVACVPKVIEGFQLWSGGAGTFVEVLSLEFPKCGAIVTKLIGIFSRIGSVAGTVFSNIGKVVTTFGATFAGIAAVIGGCIMAVVNFVDMFKNGFSVVKEILMVVGIAIAAVGAVILGAPVLVAAAIAGIVATVATLIVVIKDNWKQIGEFFMSLGSSIITNVSAVISEVVTFFSQLPSNIWTFLTNVITSISQWGGQMLSTMTMAATSAINAVINWFSQLPGRLWALLLSTVTFVIQWAAQLLNHMRTAAQNAINAVINFFKQLPGNVQTIFSNVITNLIQWASEMVSKASSAADGFVNAIVNGITGLPDTMKTIGSNIVDGIWNGISSSWKWLTDKVKDLAQGLLDGAKDALGIHSPSKKFASEVGRWIPLGIGKGVENAMPLLETEMGVQMDALAARMQAKVALETGNMTVRMGAEVTHKAQAEGSQGGIITYDNRITQENTYNTPVATPSEVARSQREAARKLLGGVK